MPNPFAAQCDRINARKHHLRPDSQEKVRLMTKIIRAINEKPLDAKTLASRPKPLQPVPRVAREKPAITDSAPKAVRAKSGKQIRVRHKTVPLSVNTPFALTASKPRLTTGAKKATANQNRQSTIKQAVSKPKSPANLPLKDEIGKSAGTDWKTFKRIASAQGSKTGSVEKSIKRANSYAKWALSHPFQAGRS